MMKVVILGGGFCGASIAKKLDSHPELEVTLVDKKKYFEYSPSLPKLLITPSYHQRIIIPFEKFLKNTRIVTEPVDRVTPESVELKKETLLFDYLVLSTGIEYPIFLNDTTHVFTVKSGLEVTQYAPQIKQATTILVIGGGLVGTEVAGELATQMFQKQIILIHLHNRLLERNAEPVSGYAKKYLEEQGVKIILGEKVVDHRNGVFITDTQRHINADTAIWCAGIKSNPYYMKLFPPLIFTKQESLKVNHFLQLGGHPNIFVGGDITSISEEKTAANAEQHAAVISENILRTIQKKPLYIYTPRKKPLLISLGNWDGILTYPPVMLPGFIPAIIKLIIEKVVLKRLQ